MRGIGHVHFCAHHEPSKRLQELFQEIVQLKSQLQFDDPKNDMKQSENEINEMKLKLEMMENDFRQQFDSIYTCWSQVNVDNLPGEFVDEEDMNENKIENESEEMCIDCEYKYPSYENHPSKKYISKLKSNERWNHLIDLKNMTLRHISCPPSHKRKSKKIKNGKYCMVCKLGFMIHGHKNKKVNVYMKEKRLKTTIIVEKIGKTNNVKGYLKMKRNDYLMGEHSTPLLLLNNANCNLQLIVDPIANFQYITKYISKSETKSKTFRELLKNNSKRFQSQSFYQLLRSSIIQQEGYRDISLQEICHYLCSNDSPFYGFNKKYDLKTLWIDINENQTPTSLKKERRTKWNKEENGWKSDTFTYYSHKNIWLFRYSTRPKNEENLSFNEFFQKYDIGKNGKLKDRNNKKHKKYFLEIAPSYGMYKKSHENYVKYIKTQFIKYHQWRDDYTILYNDLTDKEILEKWSTFKEKHKEQMFEHDFSESLENVDLLRKQYKNNFEHKTDHEKEEEERKLQEKDSLYVDELERVDSKYDEKEDKKFDEKWKNIENSQQIVFEENDANIGEIHWCSDQKIAICKRFQKQYLKCKAKTKINWNKKNFKTLNQNDLSFRQVCAIAILEKEYEKYKENPIPKNENFRMILTGVPGGGKSASINYIRNKYEKDDIITISAATNAAANNLGGSSYCSKYKIRLKINGQKEYIYDELNEQHKIDLRLETWKKFHIIDECYMNGLRRETSLHNRLNMLYGDKVSTNTYHGGLPFVYVGDFYQMKPFGSFGRPGKSLIDNVEENSTMKNASDAYKSIENVIYLNENLRNEEPRTKMLHDTLRLPWWKSEKEEWENLKWFSEEEYVKRNGTLDENECTYLNFNRQPVYEHNVKVMKNINNIFQINSHHITDNKNLCLNEVESKYFNDLESQIFVKKDTEMILNRSLNRHIGLFKNARVIIKDVIWSQKNQNKLDWLPDMIIANVPTYTGPQIFKNHPTYIPIFPTSISIDSNGKNKYNLEGKGKIKRRQFPLSNIKGFTTGKAQGLTIKNKVIYEFQKITPENLKKKLKYYQSPEFPGNSLTATSRHTGDNNLIIRGTYSKKMIDTMKKSNENIQRYVESLRLEKLHQKTIYKYKKIIELWIKNNLNENSRIYKSVEFTKWKNNNTYDDIKSDIEKEIKQYENILKRKNQFASKKQSKKKKIDELDKNIDKEINKKINGKRSKSTRKDEKRKRKKSSVNTEVYDYEDESEDDDQIITHLLKDLKCKNQGTTLLCGSFALQK